VEIFNDFFEPFQGWEFISRAGHVLAGITWIGLLYFFNVVQVPAYAQLSDGSRAEALRKLTFRALWWFRYAALLTFLFGISILGIRAGADGGWFGSEEVFGYVPGYLEGLGGTAILTGMLFGITMFLNVWGVIWRNQKIVIGSANRVHDGSSPDPEAPAAAKKAARASRANTFFSFTMLWFMVFAAHGGWFGGGQIDGSVIPYWILVLVLWGVVEASALGLIGGIDNAINKALFDDHRNTIIYGFVLLAIIYFVGWELMLAP
jgi:uncharacterized membrane protein